MADPRCGHRTASATTSMWPEQSPATGQIWLEQGFAGPICLQITGSRSPFLQRLNHGVGSESAQDFSWSECMRKQVYEASGRCCLSRAFQIGPNWNLNRLFASSNPLLDSFAWLLSDCLPFSFLGADPSVFSCRKWQRRSSGRESSASKSYSGSGRGSSAFKHYSGASFLMQTSAEYSKNRMKGRFSKV